MVSLEKIEFAPARKHKACSATLSRARPAERRTTDVGITGKKKLPLLDLDAELKVFEQEERKRLGLDGKTEQWVEDMVNLSFTKSQRANRPATLSSWVKTGKA